MHLPPEINKLIIRLIFITTSHKLITKNYPRRAVHFSCISNLSIFLHLILFMLDVFTQIIVFLHIIRHAGVSGTKWNFHCHFVFLSISFNSSNSLKPVVRLSVCPSVRQSHQVIFTNWWLHTVARARRALATVCYSWVRRPLAPRRRAEFLVLLKENESKGEWLKDDARTYKHYDFREFYVHDRPVQIQYGWFNI